MNLVVSVITGKADTSEEDMSMDIQIGRMVHLIYGKILCMSLSERRMRKKDGSGSWSRLRCSGLGTSEMALVERDKGAFLFKIVACDGIMTSE